MITGDSRKKRKNSLIAWLLIVPSFTFLCLFTLYPIIRTIYSSFFSISLSSTGKQFIGLQNYINIFNDEVFRKAFVNNLLVAAVTIPISIGLAVAMALFANSARWLKGIVRIAYFYPTILPMIAAANIWLFVYTPKYGLLGYLNKTWNFLGTPKTAIWALMVMLIWKEAGYLMIFYLSALQNISKDFYEAAKIDGAKSYQIFTFITWPLLKPTTLFVTIVSLTNAYKLVDHLYIMTKGGPSNSTNMLMYYTYQLGFDFWDIGKASSITAILVTLLLIISCIQFYAQDKKTFYS